MNKRIKLTWELCIKIAKGAALGVFYLHSLNPVILHRDLKSSNILVCFTLFHLYLFLLFIIINK